VRCTICNDIVKKAQLYRGDRGTEYEGKPLCPDCYDDGDFSAVVMYGRDEEPKVISRTRNDTEGDFRVKWVSTDPWRGYYEIESDAYARVHQADSLHGHESQTVLKGFDSRIMELYDDRGIEYARALARSSNVFYGRYSLFVRKEQAAPGAVLVGAAKAEVDFDNPRWQRNIIFDEATLGEVAKLFPERGIQTDFDVVKLAKDYGEGLMDELDKRTKKQPKIAGREYVV